MQSLKPIRLFRYEKYGQPVFFLDSRQKTTCIFVNLSGILGQKNIIYFEYLYRPWIGSNKIMGSDLSYLSLLIPTIRTKLCSLRDFFILTHTKLKNGASPKTSCIIYKNMLLSRINKLQQKSHNTLLQSDLHHEYLREDVPYVKKPEDVKPSGKKARQQIFNEQEVLLLSQVYMRGGSLDAIHGTSKKGDIMWNDIKISYNCLRPCPLLKILNHKNTLSYPYFSPCPSSARVGFFFESRSESKVD